MIIYMSKLQLFYKIAFLKFFRSNSGSCRPILKFFFYFLPFDVSKHFRKFQRSSTLPRRDKQVGSEKNHFFRWIIMKRLDFSRNEGTKKKKLVGHFVLHVMAYSNIWFTYTFLFVFLLVYVRNYFTHTFSFLCRRTQNVLQRQETFGWELDEHYQ